MIDAQDRVSSKSEELSPAKRALLELRLKQKGRLNSYDLIPRRDPSGPALLSFTQELLWLQDQLVPGPAYNVPRVWRIRGDIDVPALTATLRDLVFRHEVLRTRFVIAEGHPVQIIDEDVVPVLERIDLQSLPAENHEHQVMEYIRERANCIFDLAEGPLMKSSLLQLGPQEYVLMLVTHHIASDGWSRDVLFRELAELYDAHHTGRLPQVPDLPIQYADFAAWQRNVMQGAVVQSHLDYWKRQLAGAPALLELPTDYPRPAVQTYHGNSVRKLLLAPSELSDLKALGRESKTTLFMTTLACAMALLYRHTGQTDILIATPISGRNHAETENLLGYFMNMLVLRIRLSGEMTFRNLLQQVRQVTLEAFEHQFVPYEKLFMELNPERSPSYNPLFQVVFGFGQAASAPLNLTGLTTTTLIVDRGVAKFDLTISTSEAETGLLGTLEYNTDLFTPETIARMMDRHERLIKGVLANPDATIAELPLLSDTERKQLLVEWNDTCVEYPEATNLMELFEAQVSRTPNAIAVEYAGRKLTYAEVNLQANQLAYYLRRCEVGPEVPVGILIERSAELIVGLLGILKAGGAYVPLDENYPPERIRHILQRAQIPVVVTHQALSKSLDGYEGRIVCLDQEAQQLTQESRQNPSPTAEADSLAYVMFTSGSTGEPKGIAVPHTALMHFVRAAGDLYTLKPTDRVLQFASIGFDTSIEEIFPCLTIGATLVMRTCEMLDTQALFWQLCEDWGITMLSLPTAFWHELTRTANFKAMVPEALRLVVLGGEKARADRLAIWQDQVGPRIQLLNTYGPTETTVVATACDITAPVSGEIPIGRPISNVRVYLLDGLGQLVPRGSVGEITIGGAGVARGYLHDAERTEACFVPDPFVPEGRLYKTGDLGRYAADGNIEFLGRCDNQVKIRGFRIELGEIESVLAQHPQVKEAVILAPETEDQERRLVAYVVPTAEEELTASMLQSYLQDRFPGFMIPNLILFLPELPKTPGGKIDRRCLPAADWSQGNASGEFVAPTSSWEEKLAGIWQTVLALSRISVDANFFDLGGHSLLAIRLLSEIKQECSLSLSLAEMFKAPTISQMARLLQRKEEGEDRWSPLVPLQPNGDRLPLFCAPVGGGSAFYYRSLAQHIGPEQPLYVFEPIGMNGIDPPHETIEEMAAYYIRHMRIQQPYGPYSLCGLSLGGLIAYEMARQLLAVGESVGCLLLLDTWAPGYPLARKMRYFKKLRGTVQHLRYMTGFHTENLSAYSTFPNRWKYVCTRTQHLKRRWLDWRDGKSLALSRENPINQLLPEVYQKVNIADAQARKNYRPESYSGRILLLRAHLQRPGVKPEPMLGWNHFSTNIEVIQTPGSHNSLLDEPCVSLTVKHILKALESNGSEPNPISEGTTHALQHTS